MNSRKQIRRTFFKTTTATPALLAAGEKFADKSKLADNKAKGAKEAKKKGLRVLGIIGSPRRSGNTETLVEEACRGAREKGAQTETVHFGELIIDHCTGCGGCFKVGKCTINDDFNGIIEKIKASDALILATPVYFYNVSSRMKAFIDRSFSVLDRNFNSLFDSQISGKKAVLIVTCAYPFEFEIVPETIKRKWGEVKKISPNIPDNMTGDALIALKQFCIVHELTLVGEMKAMGFGIDPKIPDFRIGVKERPELLKEALQLGEKLT